MSLLLIAGAFLLGSIPFGLLIGRAVAGIDVRAHGSGNLGATNVLRVLGTRWGLLALLLDGGKGALAIALLPRVVRALAGAGPVSGSPLLGPLPGDAIAAEEVALIWTCAAWLAAVAGHVFSPWVGFRGGKGVATALGGALALDLPTGLLGIALFVVTVALTRFVSVASGLMVLAFPALLAWRRPLEPLTPVVVSGAVVALLVLWRHQANWHRLVRGRENRLGRPAPPPARREEGN